MKNIFEIPTLKIILLVNDVITTSDNLPPSPDQELPDLDIGV